MSYLKRDDIPSKKSEEDKKLKTYMCWRKQTKYLFQSNRRFSKNVYFNRVRSVDIVIIAVVKTLRTYDFHSHNKQISSAHRSNKK